MMGFSTGIAPPQRRFNRRLVSGSGAGESRHSTPKSLLFGAPYAPNAA
jgi:hypothetical protein